MGAAAREQRWRERQAALNPTLIAILSENEKWTVQWTKNFFVISKKCSFRWGNRNAVPLGNELRTGSDWLIILQFPCFFFLFPWGFSFCVIWNLPWLIVYSLYCCDLGNINKTRILFIFKRIHSFCFHLLLYHWHRVWELGTESHLWWKPSLSASSPNGPRRVPNQRSEVIHRSMPISQCLNTFYTVTKSSSVGGISASPFFFSAAWSSNISFWT